jgi:hypothetical protein
MNANPTCRSLRPKRGLRVKANGDETFVEEDEAGNALIGISPPVSHAPTRTSGATDTKRLFFRDKRRCRLHRKRRRNQSGAFWE